MHSAQTYKNPGTIKSIQGSLISLFALPAGQGQQKNKESELPSQTAIPIPLIRLN